MSVYFRRGGGSSEGPQKFPATPTPIKKEQSLSLLGILVVMDFGTVTSME